MTLDDTSGDEFTEKIKILSTDDEKIKSFGELLTNDSSREILQLLFNEELTANQIAQRTNISLQLVKYHLNKLQDLGVVKITKIEKNSKSQDMKIYSATKFSIVIVPPKLSEKTKESKLLVRSFRHIYKVAGLGIATGISGLFSLSLLQQEKQIPVQTDVVSNQESFSGEEKPTEELERAKSIASDESDSFMASSPATESGDFVDADPDPVITATDIDDVTLGSSDLFVAFIIVTIILGGLTGYYLWKSLKKSG